MSHSPIPNTLLRGCGFHHVAIRAWDFDKTLTFYTDGLGFHAKIAWGEKPSRAVMLDTGDGNYLEVFEGNTTAGPKPEGAILHFALRVDSCDAALARAVAAGAQVTMESKTVDIPSTPTGPTPVRIAFVKGPDGETIEFFENTLT
jgi:glyoxylase I family protein